ncbi:hypothetical protein FRC12_017931, partial [Ceratobasidium sp. 428]
EHVCSALDGTEFNGSGGAGRIVFGAGQDESERIWPRVVARNGSRRGSNVILCGKVQRPTLVYPSAGDVNRIEGARGRKGVLDADADG